MHDFIQLTLNIIISVILIYNLHLFWEYLKDTYSIRKHKNVIDTHKQIMSEFVQAPTKSTLSETDLREMNDELVAFMEQQSMPDRL
jgi:uncharacterized membrane protein